MSELKSKRIKEKEKEKKEKKLGNIVK